MFQEGNVTASASNVLAVRSSIAAKSRFTDTAKPKLLHSSSREDTARFAVIALGPLDCCPLVLLDEFKANRETFDATLRLCPPQRVAIRLRHSTRLSDDLDNIQYLITLTAWVVKSRFSMGRTGQQWQSSLKALAAALVMAASLKTKTASVPNLRALGPARTSLTLRSRRN